MPRRNFIHPRVSFPKQPGICKRPCSKIAPCSQTQLLLRAAGRSQPAQTAPLGLGSQLLRERAKPAATIPGSTGTPRAGDRPGGCGAIPDELAGVVMGFTDTNGLYGFNPTLILQPGHLWEIQLCVQRGKKYRFIAQILLMVFLSWKKQFCLEVIWLHRASSRTNTATESWRILSWEGPTWVTRSSSWPCRGHAKNPTMCLV